MLDVIFEDNHILVVVKPQNIPSQEDESMDENMVSLVKKYLKEKYNKPGNVYVGLVHRLDRPTGGIMVFAKTGKASARLTEQLQSGEMKKTYLTVVNGAPKEDEKEQSDVFELSSSEEKDDLLMADLESIGDKIKNFWFKAKNSFKEEKSEEL